MPQYSTMQRYHTQVSLVTKSNLSPVAWYFTQPNQAWYTHSYTSSQRQRYSSKLVYLYTEVLNAVLGLSCATCSIKATNLCEHRDQQKTVGLHVGTQACLHTERQSSMLNFKINWDHTQTNADFYLQKQKGYSHIKLMVLRQNEL